MNPTATALDRHRAHLWGLCYRLTGDAAEAEDLVQDTFTRALAHPPSDPSRPWRPWLTRIATNLAIDLLRRRGHQAYAGPWLPSPVPTPALAGLELAAAPDAEPEARYEVLESASFAFLCLLERLDPRQRAVLVLVDVIGHSATEVAEFLDLTAANVRQILARARASVRAGGGAPRSPPRRSSEALFARMLELIAAADLPALVGLLSPEVQFHSDSAGEFRAARNVVHGADRVAALLMGLYQRGGAPSWSSLADINGEPALLARFPDDVGDERQARRVVLRVDAAPGGAQVAAVHVILAAHKLAAVDFGAAG